MDVPELKEKNHHFPLTFLPTTIEEYSVLRCVWTSPIAYNNWDTLYYIYSIHTNNIELDFLFVKQYPVKHSIGPQVFIMIINS